MPTPGSTDPTAAPAVLLKITRSTGAVDDARALYEQTRGWWALGPRRDDHELAVAVVDGRVAQVYRIERWAPWDETVPGFAADARTRWGFTGQPDPRAAAAVGQDLSHLWPPGAADPIRYAEVVLETGEVVDRSRQAPDRAVGRGDPEAARALRTAADAAGGQTVVRMTALMSSWGRRNLNTRLREEMRADLLDAGLRTEPDLLDASPGDTVQIFSPAASEAAVSSGGGSAGLPVVLATRRLERDTWQDGSGELPGDRPYVLELDGSTTTPETLTALLTHLRWDVGQTLVSDLTDQDDEPSARRSGASVLASFVEYHRADEPGDRDLGVAAVAVELLAERSRMVVVRRPPLSISRSETSAHAAEAEGPVLPMLGTEAGELVAARVLQGLAASAAVRRDLAARLEQRLRDLTQEDDLTREDGAGALRGDVGLLPDLVTATGQMERRARDLADALSGLGTDHDESPRLGRVPEQLRSHADALATMRVSVQAGLQLEAAARGRVAAGATERFQNDLSVAAAVLLVPTLVASIFGGSQLISDSWWDLVAMVAIMFVAGAGSVAAVKRFRRQHASRPGR